MLRACHRYTPWPPSPRGPHLPLAPSPSRAFSRPSTRPRSESCHLTPRPPSPPGPHPNPHPHPHQNPNPNPNPPSPPGPHRALHVRGPRHAAVAPRQRPPPLLLDPLVAGAAPRHICILYCNTIPHPHAHAVVCTSPCTSPYRIQSRGWMGIRVHLWGGGATPWMHGTHPSRRPSPAPGGPGPDMAMTPALPPPPSRRAATSKAVRLAYYG